MTQIISNNNGGGGGASYTAGTGIDISSENEISIDTDVVQTVGNMVNDLTGADDDHYPTAKAVADAISGGGLGDVIGPASSTDGDIVLFDGVSGKLIKDSGALLSSKLDASAMSNNNYGGAWQGDSTHTPTKGVLYDKIHTMDVEIGNKAADTTVVKLTGNQTINGTKTFGTSPVVPSKSTDATNTGTAIATEAQVYNVQQDVDAIDDLIPTEATSSNKLADKNYVNDSINSVTAYYITKNAQGDQWSTYAELAAATTFYSGGVARTPTRNDYTIVLADENHDNATTRYIYNSGWEYQYTVNETALTQAQLDAINSGITAAKVSTYDGYASQISGKQDTLVSGTNIKTINNNSLLGSGDLAINEVPAGGTEGQVLTKTNDGIDWENPTGFSPENTGNTGDKLGKTASGYQWVEGELVEIRDDYSAIQGPAPEGFHVPLITEWQGLKTIIDGLGLTTGDNWRINLHMPFAGCRNSYAAELLNQGSYGLYWSSSPHTDYPNYARRLRLRSSDVSASNFDDRAYGLSVRCFKNSFELPTASWTVIQGTLGSAGIFWDTVNGLISITGDGTTGYTIQDKNLGATTVYSDGDTLAQANMGNMYQWGNNYGFSSTGSVTTSTTQVDASAYGPGNYYSGSTYITANADWSSVQNDNLRGGVTGIIYGGKYVGGEKINEVPTDGTVGQVLTKTDTGYEWQDGGNTPEPVIEEKIVYKMNADGSGKLYIPTGGYLGGAANPYDWKVSVDNGAETQYTGISSTQGMITLSGYTANSNHTITIKPTTEAYGWAGAFGGYWSTTYGSLATEIVYDKSYKGFAVSATDTGTLFRRQQYCNRTNIKEAPEEYLPDTVTTIGNQFRYDQYYGCISLIKAADEVMPDTVTTIGNYFRYGQYRECYNLELAGKESLSNSITSIPDDFREEQYNNAKKITEAPNEVMGDKVTSIGSSFRMSEYNGCINLRKAGQEYISKSVTTIGNSFRGSQYYRCYPLTEAPRECLPSSVTTILGGFRANQYNHCPNLVSINGWIDRSITVGSSYRNSQFSKQKSTNINVLVIGSPGNVNADNNVFYNNTVTVYAEDSTKQTELQNSTYRPRSSISDSNIYSLI